MECKIVNYIQVTWIGTNRFCEKYNEFCGSLKGQVFLDQLNECHLLEDSVP
jgi:hypothetical protein